MGEEASYAPTASPLGCGPNSCKHWTGKNGRGFFLGIQTKVSTILMDQRPFHISELFLQAFYLATQNEHPIVHSVRRASDTERDGGPGGRR